MLKHVSGPDAEPLTLHQAKGHLRVDDSGEDVLISALIIAARQKAEHQLGRPILTQTFLRTLDCFPDGCIRLCYDVLEVQEFVFTATDGTPAILDAADYQFRRQEYLRPADGTWPEGSEIEITFTAGAWEAPEDVPQAIKQWMLLEIGALYAQRENIGSNVQALNFFDSLLDPWKMMEVA